MSFYFSFLRWLQRFDDRPYYFPPLAGLYQLLWTRYCGYDWKFSWRMALIYWRPKSSVDQMRARIAPKMEEARRRAQRREVTHD